MQNFGITDVKGQTHQECNEQTCGIEFHVNNERYELEGKELVLCPKAANSELRFRSKGCAAQTVSLLNEKFCGQVYKKGGTLTEVPLENFDFKKIASIDGLKGGELVINKKNSTDKTLIELEGTPREIVSFLNERNGHGISLSESKAKLVSIMEDGGQVQPETVIEPEPIKASLTGAELMKRYLTSKKQLGADGKEIEPHKEVKTDIQDVIFEVSQTPDIHSEKTREGGYSRTKWGLLHGNKGEILYGMKGSRVSAVEEPSDSLEDINKLLSEARADVRNAKSARDLNSANYNVAALKGDQVQRIMFDEQQALFNAGYIDTDDPEYYELTPVGKEFVEAVDARLDTRKSVQAGTDLFPEDANIKEFKPSKAHKTANEVFKAKRTKEQFREAHGIETRKDEPILYHLTFPEFCEYVKTDEEKFFDLDNAQKCKAYYRHYVIKPQLETLHPNNFLLDVKHGNLSYNRFKIIVQSADLWNTNHPVIQAVNQWHKAELGVEYSENTKAIKLKLRRLVEILQNPPTMPDGKDTYLVEALQALKKKNKKSSGLVETVLSKFDLSLYYNELGKRILLLNDLTSKDATINIAEILNLYVKKSAGALIANELPFAKLLREDYETQTKLLSYLMDKQGNFKSDIDPATAQQFYNDFIETKTKLYTEETYGMIGSAQAESVFENEIEQINQWIKVYQAKTNQIVIKIIDPFSITKEIESQQEALKLSDEKLAGLVETIKNDSKANPLRDRLFAMEGNAEDKLNALNEYEAKYNLTEAARINADKIREELIIVRDKEGVQKKYSNPKGYNSEIEVGQKYYDNRHGASYTIEKIIPVEDDAKVTIKYDKGKTEIESGNFLLYHIDQKQHSLWKQNLPEVVQPIIDKSAPTHKKFITAGFAIFYKDKILLTHPTNAAWYHTYSIPKGNLEQGEDNLTAALREVKEEVGITIPKHLITDTVLDSKVVTSYTNHTHRFDKTITGYPLHIEKLSDIGLPDELPESKEGNILLPKSMLQLEECDWAGFVPMVEAKRRISNRQHDFLLLEVNASPKEDRPSDETQTKKTGGSITALGSGIKDSKIYYNSHGHADTFANIREVEVEERGNYTNEDFDSWAKEYGIQPEDKVIWVTPDKKQVVTYMAESEHYDKIMGMNEKQLEKYISKLEETPVEFTDEQGVLIKESNDGDNGFLFVIKDNKKAKGGEISFTDYKDALVGAKTMLEYAKGKEKQDLREYIAGLKIVMETIDERLYGNVGEEFKSREKRGVALVKATSWRSQDKMDEYEMVDRNYKLAMYEVPKKDLEKVLKIKGVYQIERKNRPVRYSLKEGGDIESVKQKAPEIVENENPERWEKKKTHITDLANNMRSLKINISNDLKANA